MLKKINLFSQNLDAILLALLVCTAIAQQESFEEKNDEVQEPQQAANFIQSNFMNRMRYSAMNNQMMMAPPQQAVDYYSKVKDEEFPVDYSLACSNTCSCRQYCVTFWWYV